MQKYICNKSLIEILRQHIITRKKFSNQKIDEAEIRHEIHFLFKTLRGEDNIPNCVTLHANEKLVLKDCNTRVFYIGFNLSIHEFEVSQGIKGYAKTHIKHIQVRSNEIITIGNKHFLVLGNEDFVNLISF